MEELLMARMYDLTIFPWFFRSLGVRRAMLWVLTGIAEYLAAGVMSRISES